MVKDLTDGQDVHGESEQKKEHVAHGELVCTKCSLFDVRRA